MQLRLFESGLAPTGWPSGHARLVLVVMAVALPIAAIATSWADRVHSEAWWALAVIVELLISLLLVRSIVFLLRCHGSEAQPGGESPTRRADREL